MQYQKHTLASGLQVELRPRTYAEWEDDIRTRERLLNEKFEAMRESNPGLVEVAFNVLGVDFREKRLALCVRDWEAVKGGLSLRDVREVEKTLTDLEASDVETGN